ncbi:MAG: hypothetical protein Q8O76_07670 [Chloroflexota bacterium]|nr:hypothetical protein [Chloroflexota bacterium]
MDAAFWAVFEGLAETLNARLQPKEPIRAIISPAWDFPAGAFLVQGNKILLEEWRYIWELCWQSEEEMQRQLASWYGLAAARMESERRLSDRERQALADILDYMKVSIKDSLAKGGYPRIHVHRQEVEILEVLLGDKAGLEPP